MTPGGRISGSGDMLTGIAFWSGDRRLPRGNTLGRETGGLGIPDKKITTDA